MTARALRAAVVGAGVAGLAAGLALARRGLAVAVYERAPAPRPLGAGLLLQPTGLAALAAMGLAEEVGQWGAPVRRLTGRTVKGRRVMDLTYRGVCGLGLHRGALFAALHRGALEAGAALIAGAEVLDILNPDGPAPQLALADATEAGPFDLVVVADGSASALRAKLLPRARAPLYPWGALWTIRPDPERRWEGELRQVYDGCAVMIGVMPTGRAPGADPRLAHAALFWSLRREDFGLARVAGAAALQEQIAKSWPEAAALLEGVETMAGLAEASYRDVKTGSGRRGRVLFIGDAAHGASPQLGQGANLALLDALALGHALGEAQGLDPVDAALDGYLRLRRGHNAYYQLVSGLLTPLFQSNNRFLGWLRDVGFGPMARLPLIGSAMRATLSGRAQFWPMAWRGPWEDQ